MHAIRTRTESEAEIRDRIIQSVAVDASGCWNWSKCLDRQGYGLMTKDGRTQAAHRVSHEVFIGPLGSLFCCHHCDNPKCVNPMHLFAGTHRDNMLDMVSKGRQSNRRPPGGYLKTTGEHNGRAILTKNDVDHIRELWDTGKFTQVLLAHIFQVRPRTMSHLLNRNSWK